MRSTRSSQEWDARRDDPIAAVRASYEAGVTDEFIEPIVVHGNTATRARATQRSSSTSAPTAAVS